MSRILVVDDEPAICWGLRESLADDGHTVAVAASAEEALQCAAAFAPDVVILDVRLPGLDGLAAMQPLRARLGDCPIIVMTAFGTLASAVQAVATDAFEYVTKPFDLDQMQQVVARALDSRRCTPAEQPGDLVSTDSPLVGSSPAMQRVFKQIAWAAAVDLPVLITGESGTGKELVARSIHQHGGRKAGPFIPICLAALNPNLVEGELFGHVRGAFTGATHDRAGAFELAAGGVILLDEIADTPLPLQVKLLRALENREIAPVGDVRPRTIDVRLIAATNRPLADLTAHGQFREDLYFRLSGIPIHLPPLRDRREDILPLARYFLARGGAPIAGEPFSPAAIAELLRRPWPGNVRELRNAVECAAAVARGEVLRPEHFPPAARRPAAGAAISHAVREWAQAALAEPPTAAEKSDLFERLLQLVERPLFDAVLEHCGHNLAAAAKRLGIHRETLRLKLKQARAGQAAASDDAGDG